MMTKMKIIEFWFDNLSKNKEKKLLNFLMYYFILNILPLCPYF